jgi:hypothetical protein
LEGSVAIKFPALEKIEVLLWAQVIELGVIWLRRGRLREFRVVAELIGQFGSKLRVRRAAGKEAVCPKILSETFGKEAQPCTKLCKSRFSSGSGLLME